MNKHTRVAVRLGAAIIAIGVPSMFTVPAGAAGAVTGLGFSSGQVIASAGAIPANSALSFSLRVTSAGKLDPGGAAYVSYTTNAAGDSTTAPAAQCGGQTLVTSHPLLCTADSTGHLVLTYHTPAQLPAQDNAIFTAGNTASSPSVSAITHYVYSTVFRFGPSPIAPSGTLGPNASVQVTLTGEGGLDTGIPNLPVFLSFNQAAGGGSALVGSTQLTSTPTLFTANGSGALTITYTTPGVLTASGIDSIMVQDRSSSPTEFNTDSYDFAAGAPVISVGDSNVTQAHGKPGIPGTMTVTISPPQKTATTVQYVSICGIGDKWCSEDFTQVTTPKTIKIGAFKTSTTITVRQFSYGGANGGENFNEGWFVKLQNPSVGVIGRAVGEGVLLPDIENDSLPPNMWVGDAGVVPTTDTTGVPVWFVVTMGRTESTAVTFSYATANGSAVAGTNYTAVTGTGTIAAGNTSALIEVMIPSQPVPASSLTFAMTISGDSAGLTILRPTGTGTLLSS
jgi:hypothetical protein